MKQQINLDEVKDYLKSLVAEVAEITVSEVTEEASFVDDLGVDSMMALEIVANIEKKYKVVIPEEEIPRIQSLKDVVDIFLNVCCRNK